MTKLGQNTNSKLLNGIFVSLLLWAVSMISSVTVLNKSLLTWGRRAMSEAIACKRVSEAVRGANVGSAKVESDGAFRSWALSRGFEGKPGPRPRSGIVLDPILD